MPCLVFVSVSSNTTSIGVWYSSRPGVGDPSFKPASLPFNAALGVATKISDSKVMYTNPFIRDPEHQNQGIFSGANYLYDYISNIWSMKTIFPEALAFSSSAQISNNLISVLGGWFNDYLNSNYVYNLSSNSWSIKANMPTARASLGAEQIDNNIIAAVGGYNGGTYSLTVNEVYNYTSNTWTIKANPAYPKTGDFLFKIQNNILLAVGYTIAGNATEVYNYTNNIWSIKTPPPSDSFENHFTGAYIRNGLAALVTKNGTVIYDYSSNTWYNAIPMPTSRIHMSASDLTPGSIIVLGGSIEDGQNLWGSTVNEILVYEVFYYPL